MRKALHKKIMARAGKESYGVIAQDLGISRNAVAGILFRARHPYKDRVSSPNGHYGNKIGSGYRRGVHAPKTLYAGRA